MEYKRCKTCKSIYPADIFDGPKYDKSGNKPIYIRECPYCKRPESLGTFEKVRLKIIKGEWMINEIIYVGLHMGLAGIVIGDMLLIVKCFSLLRKRGK